MNSIKITLREERHGRDQRYLWAHLGDDGSLHIDGQDLGPGTAPVSGDGEYEWFSTIQATDVPHLIELLGGEAGTDVLALLADRYAGGGSYDLERIIRESDIHVKHFSY